jgi:hypothetical protein
VPRNWNSIACRLLRKAVNGIICHRRGRRRHVSLKVNPLFAHLIRQM